MSASDKPTPSEPGAAGLAKSLEERLSIPDDKKNANGTKPNMVASQKFDWADEVTTPVAESDKATDNSDEKKNGLENAQKDGATSFMYGSAGLQEPEFDVNVTLADLQEDPNNPLYSAKTFEELDLPGDLKSGLLQMSYRKPSKIQERALPLLLKNPPQNLIGQSQSGTGKTAAFVLNMLARVDLSLKAPQCLVLAPTRELARQISSVAQTMGFLMVEKGLRIEEVIPDPTRRGIKFEGHVLVGTPGSTMDMLKRRLIDPRNIKVFTLDEADNMLALQGLGDQCKRVKQSLPKDVQVVLFSATFPDDVLQFASVFAPKSNKITLQVEALTVKGIKQMYLDCDTDEEKYNTLVKFYELMTIASSIIFVKRRDSAQEIERRMTAQGHKVASLTGGLEGKERDEVYQRFKSGQAKVLITTNVLARGIDVDTVTLVINYDLPETFDGKPDYETYLHRIGRTGRFGRTGAALSFVHDRKSWEMLMDICKHFQVEPTRLDTSDWDRLEKMLKVIMKNARNNVGSAPEAEMGG